MKAKESQVPLLVTAFVGSARKKHTHRYTAKFLEKLESHGNVDTELVVLSDYNLKICRGCKLCFEKGEELCPLKDDRDLLLEKIRQSDGVVFASPNYAFQVSGQMKVFLDRFGFYMHRPDFFGKAYTCLVTQGIYGGKAIVKYLSFVGDSLGFNRIRGIVLNTLEPMTEKARRANDRSIDKLCLKYHRVLCKQAYPVPSLFKLLLYRLSRSTMKIMLDENFRDYTYFTEKGWFESDYYYPVALNPVKKYLGRFFDYAGRRMAKAGS
ncbi:MAG: flavodoxin family protein [Bacteroidales bacterium]